MKKLLRRFSSVGIPLSSSSTPTSASSPTLQKAAAPSSSVTALSQVPENLPTSPYQCTVDELLVKDRNGRSTDGKPGGKYLDTIPVILQQFVQYLQMPEAITMEGLFRTAGSAKFIRELREDIEATGIVDLTTVDPVEIASVAALLKQWLRDIPDGLVPKEFFQPFIDADCLLTPMREILATIPRSNCLSLEYLCRFLIQVASHSDLNRMSLQNLVIVFAPNVFRCPSAAVGTDKGDPQKYLVESMQITKTMTVMLEHFDEVFNEALPFPTKNLKREQKHTRGHPLTASEGSLERKIIRSSDAKDLFQHRSSSSLLDKKKTSISEGEFATLTHARSDTSSVGVRSRLTTDASWSGDSAESTPDGSPHCSPTLSQRRMLNAVVRETVGSMLFNEPSSKEAQRTGQPRRGSEGLLSPQKEAYRHSSFEPTATGSTDPFNTVDDNRPVRPSVIAQSRMRSLSAATSPTTYGDIRGAQQSLMDELNQTDSPEPEADDYVRPSAALPLNLMTELKGKLNTYAPIAEVWKSDLP
ncbi:hypothetical protein HK101_008347 [Irineochytrium annulatum]|nr:hypothetical protein HK101_008347 [Irineochytrium annulatum]